jgi:hypothetical protein
MFQKQLCQEPLGRERERPIGGVPELGAPLLKLQTAERPFRGTGGRSSCKNRIQAAATATCQPGSPPRVTFQPAPAPSPSTTPSIHQSIITLVHQQSSAIDYGNIAIKAVIYLQSSRDSCCHAPFLNEPVRHLPFVRYQRRSRHRPETKQTFPTSTTSSPECRSSRRRKSTTAS